MEEGNTHKDITIEDLEETAYLKIKAEAVKRGKRAADLFNEAMRLWLNQNANDRLGEKERLTVDELESLDEGGSSSEVLQKAQGILNEHGLSSMDYIKILPDKSLFFSDDGSSFLSYGVSENVAIVLGDPIGPQDKMEQMISAFLNFCQGKKWCLAFHQTLPNYIPIYKKLDLEVVKVGEDAIIDLFKFCNSTVNNVHFRHIKRKFEKEGYVCRPHIPPHAASLLDKVEDVSKEWLTLPGRRERAFTVGHFNREYLNTTPLYCLEDPSGNVIAFMNLIPSYKRGEATIDLMRHRIDVPNSCMDNMFLHLFEEKI